MSNPNSRNPETDAPPVQQSVYSEINSLQFAAAFLDELLIYSGQYALFYIIMNLSEDLWNYFSNFGHAVLLAVLLAQTLFLARMGMHPVYRFMGSLIVPLCYTLVEQEEGLQFALNGAHVFFWIFSLLTGSLHALSIKVVKSAAKAVLEFFISTLNVLAFLFLYYFFELRLDLTPQLAAGALSEEQYHEALEFYRMFSGYPAFLRDPSHVYVLIAGLILSLSISMSRVKNLLLKERIRELFGSYVDKNVSDKIIKHHGGGAERKFVCVLFSDIRGFTALSERSSAADITTMLNTYFSQWESAIGRHNGIIDKYIGDAIMVVFGIENPEHACRDAVLTAQEMLGKLADITNGLSAKGLPFFNDIGIGIHYGSAIVGDVGSTTRRNYTVIGDTVNIASRLEGQCKQYNTSLLISTTVYERLPDSVRKEFVFLDNAVLKGKTECYPIYKPGN